MAVNNYLKGYPYLFVRETDQTNYFCTICDGFLKEEELQSHLFDEHRAENCNGYFVRVCVEQTDKGYFTQKKYIFVCVVCWGKFPSSTDMSVHRQSCKISPPEDMLPAPAKRPTPNRTNSRIIEETEPTNVVSTPDISQFVDSDDEGNGGRRSVMGVSPPMSSSPPEIIVEHTKTGSGFQSSQPVKRGRKKQLHPQQVLPPYRLEERYGPDSRIPTTNGGHEDHSEPASQQQQQQQQPQFGTQFLQCSLCSDIVASSTYIKHLREFHRVGSAMDSTLCPLCVRVVPLPELPFHLTTNHSVMPQSSINSLLLWVLTINNNLTNISNKNNDIINKNVKDADKLMKQPNNASGASDENQPKPPPMTSLTPSLMPPVVNFPMMLQNVFPSLGGKLNLPVGKLFPPPQLSATTAAPTLPTLPLTPAGAPSLSAPIPSFLQALLNGDGPNAPATPDERRSFVTPTSPMPTKAAVESVVGKLTRKHVGPNDKESFQCLICSKWFAIPPVKHMRGHLVTFRDENRRHVPLTGLGGNFQVCLACFQISDSLAAVEFHVANFHPQQQQHIQPQQQSGQNGGGGHDDDLPLGATANSNNNIKYNNTPGNGAASFNSFNNSNISNVNDLSPTDPKGVELDNAGRVKSGKVRKQCELCGQWSNIKWFFKHMSEVHRALFCRCCREYLPIHEQEEHRRWHAEPPYMGQKIRIENGQPIIIDRKERASLTPIGSLAAWGGSSGGMVVKAIDDGVMPMSRKRKVASASTSDAGSSTPTKIQPSQLFGGADVSMFGKNSSKDTLMPKETCPVCGILITYKNLARHIKLRHKIKYKFCHKCRKFVPNDTYEDHKLTCIQVASSPTQRSEHNESVFSDQFSGGDCSDGHRDPMEDEMGQTPQGDVHDLVDLSNASSSVVGTPPSSSSLAGDNDLNAVGPDGRKSDSFRANTSKTKLESLLGKEFKHPRRRCTICGYTVSYSNFKRHLRNAHPSEYSQCEKDPAGDFGNAFANFSHIVDDDQGNGLSKESMEAETSAVEAESGNGNFIECRICGDHILNDFLPRHIKMNHPQDKSCDEETDNEDDAKESGDDEDVDAEPEVKEVESPEIEEIKKVEDKESASAVTAAATTTKTLRMRECPVCNVEMRAESVVKHCKLKHKISYKFCNICSKYITKMAFRSHSKKHVQARPNTRLAGEEAKMSSGQEEGETEDDESRHQNGGHEDDVDIDDDEDKLTIDMKAETTTGQEKNEAKTDDPAASKMNSELKEHETRLSQK